MLSFLLAASNAVAANFEIPANATKTYANLADNDRIRTQVENERSYCWQIVSENDEASSLVEFESGSVSSGELVDFIFRGSSAPYLGTNQNALERRVCGRFLEEVGDGENGRAIASIIIEGNGVNSTVTVSETTLFGGFNTSVTNFNFVEVSNTLATTDSFNDVVVRLTADGVIAGSRLVDTTFTLTPGQRVDVNIHDSAPSDFGPVVISHNGPPGSIKATTAQYRIVTASPLDFEPVSNVEFTSRPLP
jgi:hypothetical protein